MAKRTELMKSFLLDAQERCENASEILADLEHEFKPASDLAEEEAYVKIHDLVSSLTNAAFTISKVKDAL